MCWLAAKPVNWLRGDGTCPQDDGVVDKHAVRLGHLVKDRRVELGLTHAQVTAGGGPSAGSMQKIEHGQGGTRAAGTLADLERVLYWAPGSCRVILAGGDPTTVAVPVEHSTDSAGRPIAVTVDIGVDLSAAERRELMAAAEAEVLKRWREIRSGP